MMSFTFSGKSLYIKRLFEKLKHSTKKLTMMRCIRLIEPKVDENVILQSLLNSPTKRELAIFHFDVTSSVRISLIVTLHILYLYCKAYQDALYRGLND